MNYLEQKSKSSAVIAYPTTLIAKFSVEGCATTKSPAVSERYTGAPTVKVGKAALLTFP